MNDTGKPRSISPLMIVTLVVMAIGGVLVVMTDLPYSLQLLGNLFLIVGFVLLYLSRKKHGHKVPRIPFRRRVLVQLIMLPFLAAGIIVYLLIPGKRFLDGCIGFLLVALGLVTSIWFGTRGRQSGTDK